jgi:hypothetical protein
MGTDLVTGAVDFSALTDGLTPLLEGAATSALPIAGVVLAIGLGIKIVKRVVKS